MQPLRLSESDISPPALLSDNSATFNACAAKLSSLLSATRCQASCRSSRRHVMSCYTLPRLSNRTIFGLVQGLGAWDNAAVNVSVPHIRPTNFPFNPNHKPLLGKIRQQHGQFEPYLRAGNAKVFRTKIMNPSTYSWIRYNSE